MLVNGQKRIMLVDDNMANLNMGKNILQDYYEVYPLPSAERLFVFLEHKLPDLILMDVKMPNMSGFDAVRILKNDIRFSDIPVIFLTSEDGEEDELEGLSIGAADYVKKPFSAPILIKRIENQLLMRQQKAELKNFNDNLLKMVREKTAQVSEFQNSIISTVADIIDFRDSFTGGHINRTQQQMKILVDQLITDGYYLDETLQLDSGEYMLPATQLHDIGKIAISDTILNKNGKLTPEEFEIMKTHTTKGVEVISHIEEAGENWEFIKYAKIVAQTHHEKWDGSGYPVGIKGLEIPLLGRLMAIADVYDALISQRPYKKPFSHEEAVKIINEGNGSHFDPLLVEAFNKVEKEFENISVKKFAKIS